MPKAAQGAAKSRTADSPSSRASRTASPERDTAPADTPEARTTTSTTDPPKSAAATKTAGTSGRSAVSVTTGSTASGSGARTAAPAAGAPALRAFRDAAARLRPVRQLGQLRRPQLPAWWPIPLCLALGAIGGTVYSAVSEPQYAATSYVIVSPRGQGDPASALGYAQAYGKIATDPVILAAAESQAHLANGKLRPDIQASTSPDAPMVQITGTSTDPKQAAHYADAVARALTQTAKKSVKRTGAGLTVLSKAGSPANPVSPSTPIAVGVGACAGGLAGGLLLLARPRRNNRTATPAPATAHSGSGGPGGDGLTGPDGSGGQAHGEAGTARAESPR